MNRLSTGCSAFCLLLAVVAGITAQEDGSQYQPPRTSWGDPDLQGIYNTSTITPFERPAELGDKAFYTPEEAAEIEQGYNPDFASAGDTGTYNEFWYDAGTLLVPTLRTSLIKDPPDGRLPAITENARSMLAEVAAYQREHAMEGPESRTLPERCLWWPSTGPPLIPTFYNNNYRIIQAPGYVVIHAEMIHNARIIPLDGSAHVAPEITQWIGDSRGRWEGNTLVVETTNFTDKTKKEFGPAGIRSIRGVGANNRVTERFTPTPDNYLLYEFTIDDPETFASPWTAEFALNPTEGPIFEYACHEGNYALPNVLMGARREEQAADNNPSDSGATR